MHWLLALPGPNHAAHTTRILQPLNTSLAAAGFECWGLDHGFSWQRHPSWGLCCRSAPQSAPRPAVSPALPPSSRSRQNRAAHTQLGSVARGKPVRWETAHGAQLRPPALPEAAAQHLNSPAAPLTVLLGTALCWSDTTASSLYLPKEAPNHGFLAHSRHTVLRCWADTRSFSSIKHWYCWSSARIRVPNTPLPAGTA